MKHSRRLWGGLSGGLVLALFGPAGIAVGHFSHPVQDSSHPELGQIFGTVTDENGDPVDGVCVSTEHRWHWRWDRESTRTSGGGHYLFHSLRPGAHVVHVEPNCGGSPVRGLFAAEWFDGAVTSDQATSIKVTENATAVADVSLERAGSISVAVTDDIGNDVTTCLSAYPADAERFDVTAPDRIWDDGGVASDRAVDGIGTIEGLRSGTYRVLVGCLAGYSPERPAPFGYIPRWLPLVTVAAPDDTNVSTVLKRAGAIAGTVTDQFGKRRASRVSAWETRSNLASYTYGETDGFETGRLAPGTYRVEFRSGCGYDVIYTPASHGSSIYPCFGYGSSFDEFYDDHAATFAAATPITVLAGEATEIDAHVTVHGSNLAVTDFEVTDPEIRTAFASVPSVGVRKDVSIRIDQLGQPYYGDAKVCIWAEARTAEPDERSATQVIADENIWLGEGDHWSGSYSWTPVGAIGDIVIHAVVESQDWWYWDSDIDPSDNRRSVETYVGVGGAGGVVLSRVDYVPWAPYFLDPFPSSYCSDYA